MIIHSFLFRTEYITPEVTLIMFNDLKKLVENNQKKQETDHNWTIKKFEEL